MEWFKKTRISNLLLFYPIEKSVYGRYKLQKQSIKYKTQIRNVCKYFFIYIFGSFSWFYVINYETGKEQFNVKKNAAFFSYLSLNKNLPLFQQSVSLPKKETSENAFFFSLHDNKIIKNKERFNLNLNRKNTTLVFQGPRPSVFAFSRPKVQPKPTGPQGLTTGMIESLDLRSGPKESRLWLKGQEATSYGQQSTGQTTTCPKNQDLTGSTLAQTEGLKTKNSSSQETFAPSSFVCDFSLQNFYGKLPNKKEHNKKQKELFFYARKPLFVPGRVDLAMNLDNSTMSSLKKLTQNDQYLYSGTSMILNPSTDFLPRQLEAINRKKNLSKNEKSWVHSSTNILTYLKPQVQLTDQLQWVNYFSPKNLKNFSIARLSPRLSEPNYGPKTENFAIEAKETHKLSQIIPFGQLYWPFNKITGQSLRSNLFTLSRFEPKISSKTSLKNYKPEIYPKSQDPRGYVSGFGPLGGLDAFKPKGLGEGQLFNKKYSYKEILIKSRLQSGFIFPDAPLIHKDTITWKNGLGITIKKDSLSCQNNYHIPTNSLLPFFNTQAPQNEINNCQNLSSADILKETLKLNKLKSQTSNKVSKKSNNIEFLLNQKFKKPFVELVYELTPLNGFISYNQKICKFFLFPKKEFADSDVLDKNKVLKKKELWLDAFGETYGQPQDRRLWLGPEGHGFDVVPENGIQVPNIKFSSFNKLVNFVALDKNADLQRFNSLLVEPKLAKKIILIKELKNNLLPETFGLRTSKVKNSFSQNKFITLSTVNQNNSTLFANKSILYRPIHPLTLCNSFFQLDKNCSYQNFLNSPKNLLAPTKVKKNNQVSKKTLNQSLKVGTRAPESFFGTPYLQLGERFTIEKIKSKNQIGLFYNIHNGNNFATICWPWTFSLSQRRIGLPLKSSGPGNTLKLISPLRKIPYASAGTSLKTVFGKKWLKQQSLRKNLKASSPITTARLVSKWQISNSSLILTSGQPKGHDLGPGSLNVGPLAVSNTFDTTSQKLQEKTTQTLLGEKEVSWPLFLPKGNKEKNTYLASLFDFKRISSKVNNDIINPFKYYNPGTKRERNIEDTTLTLEGYKKSRLFSKLQTCNEGIATRAMPIQVRGYNYSSDKDIDIQSILGGMRQRTESQRKSDNTTGATVKVADSGTNFSFALPEEFSLDLPKGNGPMDPDPEGLALGLVHRTIAFDGKKESKNTYSQNREPKTKYRFTNCYPLGTILVSGSQKSLPGYGLWPNSLRPISSLEYNFNPYSSIDHKFSYLSQRASIKGLSQTKGFYFEKIFANKKLDGSKHFGKLAHAFRLGQDHGSLIKSKARHDESIGTSLEAQRTKPWSKGKVLRPKTEGLAPFGYLELIQAQKPVLKSLGKIVFFFVVWSSYKIFATPLIHSTQFLPAAFTEAVGLQSFRQKFRIISRDKTKENFQNLAGVEKTLAELRGLIWTFRLIGTGDSFVESLFSFFPYFGNQAGQKRDLFRFKERNKFLLIGPPGTGKTLLVKALAAEAKVPIIVQPVSGLQMIHGVENPVSALFHVARQIKPCIIFLDELDTLGSNFYNSKTQNPEQKIDNKLARKYTYTLLLELDGLTSSTRDLLIIGATNRPETLNSALTRAGRFETIINCDLPKENQRFAVLSLYLENFNKKKTVQFKKIDGLTKSEGLDLWSETFGLSPVAKTAGLDLWSTPVAKTAGLWPVGPKTESLTQRLRPISPIFSLPKDMVNQSLKFLSFWASSKTFSFSRLKIKRLKVNKTLENITPWKILFENYPPKLKSKEKTKNKRKEKLYISYIAEKCYGLSQASLGTIVNESALISMAQEQSTFQHTLKTLDKAVESVKVLTAQSTNYSFLKDSSNILKRKENTNRKFEVDFLTDQKNSTFNNYKSNYAFLKRSNKIQVAQIEQNSSLTLNSKNIQFKVYTAYQLTGSLVFPHIILNNRNKIKKSVNVGSNKLFKGNNALFDNLQLNLKNLDTAGYASLNLYSVTRPQNFKLSKRDLLAFGLEQPLPQKPFSNSVSQKDFFEESISKRKVQESNQSYLEFSKNSNIQSLKSKNTLNFGFQEQINSQIKTKHWLSTGWFRVYLSRPISRYDNKEYIENKEYYPQNNFAPSFRRSRSINVSTLAHRLNSNLRNPFQCRDFMTSEKSFSRINTDFPNDQTNSFNTQNQQISNVKGKIYQPNNIFNLSEIGFAVFPALGEVQGAANLVLTDFFEKPKTPILSRLMTEASSQDFSDHNLLTKNIHEDGSLKKVSKNTLKVPIPSVQDEKEEKLQNLNFRNPRLQQDFIFTKSFLYLAIIASAFHERVFIMQKNQELIDYCVYNILRYGVIYNFSIKQVFRKF